MNGDAHRRYASSIADLTTDDSTTHMVGAVHARARPQ